jgi:small subunit ribosomal protein S18
MAKPKKKIMRRKITVPKECYFCKEGKTPSYAEVGDLSKFVTERGKIVGRLRNGLCAMHQRALTDHIKYARHLALLGFVARD